MYFCQKQLNTAGKIFLMNKSFIILIDNFIKHDIQ